LMKSDAYLHDLWQHGLALVIRFVSFGICACMFWAFREGKAVLLARMPGEAKIARQFFVVQCYDAIIMERLPNMYGSLEQLYGVGVLNHDRHVCHHWLADA